MARNYYINWKLMEIVYLRNLNLTYHSDDLSIITLHIYNYSYIIDHSETRSYVSRYNLSSLNIL